MAVTNSLNNTSNSLTLTNALGVASGGTALATLTLHSLYVGNGTSAPTALGVATNGQLVIGSTGADPVLAAISAGTGITITNGAGTISIAAAGGALSWSTVTGTTQAAAVNNGYITNNAGVVTVTLPTTAAIGDSVAIAGLGAGGWSLAQNAGQLVHVGNTVSTTGAGGSVASTNAFDCTTFRCIVANTTWTAMGTQGNLTVT